SDHSTDVTRCLPLVQQGPDLTVTSVPGGLVVDDDGRAVTLRGLLDSVCLPQIHGQRLFHHHRYVAWSARLDDARVRERVGKGRDGLGFGRVEHLVEICVELVVGEVVRPGVSCQQFGVGIPNRDDDDIRRAALRTAQEAGDVAVVQPGDGDAKWFWLRWLRAGGRDKDRGGDERKWQ